MKGFVDYFIEWAQSEPAGVTVEMSIREMATPEEIAQMNEALAPQYQVDCFECETCSEYSKGKHPYHLERIEVR